MGKMINFLKNKMAHFYVLAIVFLIPLLIVANGFWRITAYQSIVNTGLTDKSKLLTETLASTLGDQIDNAQILQQIISRAKLANSEIQDIAILKPEGTNYTIFASTNPEFENLLFFDSEIVKITKDGNTLVKPYKNTDFKPAKRTWLGLALIKNDSQSNQAILITKLSSDKIDAQNRNTINISLIAMVLTIFVVFLLLVNHFRFYEYFVSYNKIREIDKMKDEFISIVSHELKTPLATVKGYLDMMFQGLTGKFDEKAREHLVKIMLNIQRLDLLISELLDVSRIEQERIQFDMQPVDVSKVIEKVLIELGENAKNKGLIIEHNTIKQMPAIFADQDRLSQVMENIISNAIKYTEKGKILISYRLKDGNVVASIQDTGIGMAPEDMKRLFQRFYRIKNEKTMDVAGTGLGLWIAKAITEKMNGKITVESKVGVGSTFSLVFPFIKD